MEFVIQSTAFSDGQTIPARYTGDGSDLSPALSWSGVPASTEELALIVDDPDAPTSQPWVHWVIYKIPADCTALLEGITPTKTLTQPAEALQGKNSWGTIGYRGPAPPPGHGVHHYHFRLYALDTTIADLQPSLDKTALLAALKGHILAQTELVATYQR